MKLLPSPIAGWQPGVSVSAGRAGRYIGTIAAKRKTAGASPAVLYELVLLELARGTQVDSENLAVISCRDLCRRGFVGGERFGFHFRRRTQTHEGYGAGNQHKGKHREPHG